MASAGTNSQILENNRGFGSREIEDAAPDSRGAPLFDRRQPRSVHIYLVRMIAGVLLPLLGFSCFLVIRSAEHEQDATATMARNRTRIAAAAIEDELGSLRARLFLLAGELSLQTSDLNEFQTSAKKDFGDMTVILSNAAGQEIVNSSVPYGLPLPVNPDQATVRQVAESQRPLIAGLPHDPIAHRPVTTINVPVSRDSQLVYVLSLDISSTLPRILGELDLPEGWIAAIFDQQGYMIARSRDADRFLGQVAHPDFLRHMKAVDNGWFSGTSREGVPMFTAFAHTRPGGWTINVGIPRDDLLAPVRQTTWTLILLGAATLALAVTLAVAIGRRIAEAVNGLVPVAEAVGRGEPVAPHRTRLIEANVVARALSDAGERLRNAAMERQAVTAALQESEQMYRSLAENLARIDEERTELLNRVVVAQENERKRIARDLHDSLSQYLTAVRLKLDTVDRPGCASPPRPEVLNELRALICQLGGAVNRMAWELRPVALDEVGLRSAVGHYLEEWSEMARLPVDVEIDLGTNELAPAIEATLFRVLQEATTNVVRHAAATRVGIILTAGRDMVLLIVEDDGRGFSAGEAEPRVIAGRRFGLLGMRERLALVHGELEVESGSRHGTTLFVRIPLANSALGKRSEG